MAADPEYGAENKGRPKVITSSPRWLRVPVGERSALWSTAPAAHTVLAIAHTVASATRLLDALGTLEGDLRIQVLFTEIPASAFDDGLSAFLEDIGAKVISWEQAVQTRFDLALSAGNSGPLHTINAPLLIMPHGAGYNKYPKTENRKPKTETRNGKPVYGLAREQLVHEGDVVPSAIVLSHREQLARLKAECPEAVSRAVIAGDICFDRLTASVRWRERYRADLDLRSGQRLVVATSTWGPESLLGRRPELFARLLADLPVDEYRVAAVVHPNVWHGHGPWQLRAWLADCRRAGLMMIPPREGWRAALVAADCVVGDHGSVTLYGAALGRPVLLGSFPDEEVDPATAMGELGRRVTLVRDDRPVRGQIERALAEHTPEYGDAIAAQAFAKRGRAAETLRDLMYRLMGLEPPHAPVRVAPVPPPVPEPRVWEHAERPALVATASVCGGPGDVVVRVERYPAELEDLHTGALPGLHLVVDGTEPDPRLRDLADIVIHRHDARGLPDGERSTQAVAEVTARGTCVFRPPGGPVVELSPVDPRGDLDPGTYASAARAWAAAGRALTDLPRELTVAAGPIEAVVRSRLVSG